VGYVTRMILLTLALAVGVGATAGLTAYLATSPVKSCACREKCGCTHCRCCGACK